MVNAIDNSLDNVLTVLCFLIKTIEAILRTICQDDEVLQSSELSKK